MKKKKIDDIKLGAFIIIGLVLFLGAVYYIGNQNQLFGADIRVNSVFNSVSGLKVGNNVRLSGINVGTVYELEIISDSSVNVTMLIEKDAARYIKTDSYALIESEGLMGNKIISIAGGSAQSPGIEDGDRIPSKSSANIDAAIETFTGTAEETRKLMLTINDIAAHIQAGRGPLGRLLTDTVLERSINILAGNLQQSSKDAVALMRSLRKTSEQINQGDGIMTKLLYDSGWTTAVERIVDSLATVSANLALTSENLRTFSQDLNNPDGALHTLLTDSAFSVDVEEVIHNIRESSDDLEDAVQTVENSWILNVFSGNKKKRKVKEASD